MENNDMKKLNILRLDEWGGQVELQGHLYRVRYRGDHQSLTIYGLSHDDAHRMLGDLSIGSTIAISPPPPATKGPAPAVQQQAPATAPPAEKAPKKVAAPASPPVPTAQEVPAPITPPSAPAAATSKGQDTLPLEQPAQAAPTPPASNGAAGTLLAAVKAARQMRDIVVALEEAGITAEDKMVEWCEANKGEVPSLSRMHNIRERVARTREAMGGVPA